MRCRRAKDNRGNSVIGKAELVDCREVLVESDGPRMSVIGLKA
jgi:mannose-1-phosphate guanylyltransferase